MANHIFTGVFIPAKIWLHKDLIPQEKMMLGEIKALSEESGWCFANNKHFADWLCCGIPNVSNYIKKFQERGMIQVKYKDLKTFSGRKMRVNLEWYHSLPAPFIGNEAPFIGNEAPFIGNETEIQFKNTSILNERGEAPAPETSTSKEEKKDSGLVAPGRDEKSTADIIFETAALYGIEAQKNESPKVALKGSLKSCPISCSPSDYCAGGKCDLNGCFIPTQFEVTAIASPTDMPGVTMVEAVPPLKRANTILDAEKKILDWATGDGLATIAMRHGMSKRHVPEDLAPLVAHYVSVYASTNEGSRASLLRDPVAHFESGLYKYLTMQNTIDRNNAPGNQAQVRNQEPPANFKSQIRH